MFLTVQLNFSAKISALVCQQYSAVFEYPTAKRSMELWYLSYWFLRWHKYFQPISVWNMCLHIWLQRESLCLAWTYDFKLQLKLGIHNQKKFGFKIISKVRCKSVKNWYLLYSLLQYNGCGPFITNKFKRFNNRFSHLNLYNTMRLINVNKCKQILGGTSIFLRFASSNYFSTNKENSLGKITNTSARNKIAQHASKDKWNLLLLD